MDEIETESIEVVAQFDGAIVDVQHLMAPRAADERRARILVAGGAAALALAAIAFLCAYAGVRGSRALDVAVAVALAGGSWALLRGLDRRADRAPSRYVTPWGRTLVHADASGRWMVGDRALARGERTTAEIERTIFFVASVPAPRRHLPAPTFDWRRELYLGGVALAASAFLFVLYSVPPEPRALALDLLHDNHFARFVIMAPEEPPPPPMPGASTSGSPGAASAGKSGRTGKPNAQSRNGSIKLPGPVSREKVLAMARDQARNAGIMPMMMQGSHVGVLFGRDNPLGDGADQILLGLQSVELHDGWGTGTSLVGDGPGGDGDKPNTIGVGPLGTVGFCPNCKPGDKSYVRSAPVGDLKHRAKAPDPVPGIVTIKCGENASCLDKEIVRRIIRQHRNEVRFCYERGLAIKPELNGRVVTMFTIANNGRVLGSSVAESSLGDRDVEQCIAQAVRRWEFPSTQQMTMVSYPFVLAPPK